jgi:hypothetical protein
MHYQFIEKTVVMNHAGAHTGCGRAGGLNNRFKSVIRSMRMRAASMAEE